MKRGVLNRSLKSLDVGKSPVILCSGSVSRDCWIQNDPAGAGLFVNEKLNWTIVPAGKIVQQA